MNCQAAIVTGRGTGALATVLIVGPQAPDAIQTLIAPKPVPTPGQIRLVQIPDLDQVTIGCEDTDRFAIHCHGNPLIVEWLLERLRDLGVTPAEPETLYHQLWQETSTTIIEQEAQHAMSHTRTLLGAQVVSQQLTTGLLPLLKSWQASPPPCLNHSCKELLTRFPATQYLLHGCTIALIGPPNSGKSTLFNRLLGYDKSIVADVHGTTRDWIDAELTLNNLHLTLLDTAGLDERLFHGPQGHIDQAAQDLVITQLDQADLILLVLDASRPQDQLESLPLDRLSPQNTLAILNKTDLPPHLSIPDPKQFHTILKTSALNDQGLTDLIQTIQTFCGTKNLNPSHPTPFTQRQYDLLETLSTLSKPTQAPPILQKLLTGDSIHPSSFNLYP